MMRRWTGREIGLALVALCSAAVWMAPGQRPYDARTDGRDDRLPAGPAPVVHLDRLDNGTPGFDRGGRDLFRYRVSPDPQSRLSIQSTIIACPSLASREQTLPKETTSRLPVSLAPALPRPGFVYIGYLGPKDDRIAVFSRDDELILARAGETVDDGFRLLELRYEEVLLGYTAAAYRGHTTRLRQQSG